MLASNFLSMCIVLFLAGPRMDDTRTEPRGASISLGSQCFLGTEIREAGTETMAFPAYVLPALWWERR